MGVHGEPGIKREKILSADDMVKQLTEKILLESGIGAGDTVCTLVNGLGATSPFRAVHHEPGGWKKELAAAGFPSMKWRWAPISPPQEMAGASITLFRLDEELKGYYDAPCRCPYYQKGETK